SEAERSDRLPADCPVLPDPGCEDWLNPPDRLAPVDRLDPLFWLAALPLLAPGPGPRWSGFCAETGAAKARAAVAPQANARVCICCLRADVPPMTTIRPRADGFPCPRLFYQCEQPFIFDHAGPRGASSGTASRAASVLAERAADAPTPAHGCWRLIPCVR